MQKILDRLVAVLSSLGLSCVLLILLALLTWLGTLEQMHAGLFEVQRKYFESFYLIHHVGPVPILLPGATLVMAVLFVNIIVGGMLRLRRGVSTVGVLITHIGIALMLVAGLVKLNFSDDGHLTLYEGQRADTFQSYTRWEVAITEKLDGDAVSETVVPEEDFLGTSGGAPVTLASGTLPFELRLEHFLPNANVFPKGPMVTSSLPVVDGFVLSPRNRDPEAERNIAGLYATVIPKSAVPESTGILWGLTRAPWTVAVDGRVFGIELRHEQYPMPFTLALDDFVKEDHPGISMARAFSSDVTLTENASTRQVKIEMNEPLRSKGLVLYQASWGPSDALPGDPLFSTLSVVRNPADQYPLYACIIIALGMVTHFSRKLAKHIRSEARKT